MIGPRTCWPPGSSKKRSMKKKSRSNKQQRKEKKRKEKTESKHWGEKNEITWHQVQNPGTTYIRRVAHVNAHTSTAVPTLVRTRYRLYTYRPFLFNPRQARDERMRSYSACNWHQVLIVLPDIYQVRCGVRSAAVHRHVKSGVGNRGLGFGLFSGVCERLHIFVFSYVPEGSSK